MHEEKVKLDFFGGMLGRCGVVNCITARVKFMFSMQALGVDVTNQQY